MFCVRFHIILFFREFKKLVNFNAVRWNFSHIYPFLGTFAINVLLCNLFLLTIKFFFELFAIFLFFIDRVLAYEKLVSAVFLLILISSVELIIFVAAINSVIFQCIFVDFLPRYVV